MSKNPYLTGHSHPVRRVFRILGLLLGGALILLFAFVGLLTILRDAPDAAVKAFGDPEGPPSIVDPEFARSIGLMTGTAMEPGHQVDLLISGEGTYPILWESMRSARRSLTAQLYYILPGSLTDTLLTVLSERARAGVPTYLLRDAIGAELPDSSLAALKSAGVHVATFRPVKWWTLHKAQNRSHVRAVVVDGIVGFTGGFGIDDRWRGNGRRTDEWRDTNVRFRGPAVRQLQAAFDRAWTEATGELLIGELFFPITPWPPADSARPPEDTRTTSPSVPAAGQGTAGSARAVGAVDAVDAARSADAAPGVTAGLMHSVATFGPTANARLFALTVAGARRTLFISNAYFVPDPSMLAHLQSAARRGVDVRLLLPGAKTDVPMTRYAARSWYETLIRSGVKVYEYQPSMLHSKTFVADGMFTSIGSMNLDYRSFALNDEANMLILDRTFGVRMDSLFMDDLRYSKQIDLATFRRRGIKEKLQERLGRLVGKAL